MDDAPMARARCKYCGREIEQWEGAPKVWLSTAGWAAMDCKKKDDGIPIGHWPEDALTSLIKEYGRG